jgi:hypothetical protein
MVVAAVLLLQGGESLIGDSAGIAAAMPESVLQRFADRGGVLYTRRYTVLLTANVNGVTALS